jgi:hypothetical protein
MLGVAHFIATQNVVMPRVIVLSVAASIGHYCLCGW